MLVGLIFFGIFINEPLRVAFPQQPDILLEITTSSQGVRDLVAIAPHENENVANDYVKAVVQARGGRFVILRQLGERHIHFRLGNLTVEVDPNRIFTKRGAASSLKKLNPDLADNRRALRKARRLAVKLGRFIIDQAELARDTTIVAVHNNTDGYDDDGKGGRGTVSIERYAKRFADGAGYIQDVHIETGDDEDDLFFINRPLDFEAMTRAGWNVILQHPRVARDDDQDDGSLSVWAEMEGLRYINIEAQRDPDHLSVQQAMVDYIWNLVLPN